MCIRDRIMSVHYENPALTPYLDSKKSKSLIGYSTNKKLSSAEERKVSRGLKKVTIPPFDAISMPVQLLNESSNLMMSSFMLLIHYSKRILRKQRTAAPPCVPLVGMISKDKSFAFIPLPEYTKFFMLVEDPIATTIPIRKFDSQKGKK
eukprot:TRINITY_DN8540_c0_g2_i3.p1 TRINITY_DN8540_c0_g2~~TRINITY_DN8540_c0_g2_i3.p1  ORF type:complete len:149 (+),score=26.68 TRINITY_DN8540_c0_g2_i3:69-515(+)